jgi:hypothetical protein
MVTIVFEAARELLDTTRTLRAIKPEKLLLKIYTVVLSLIYTADQYRAETDYCKWLADIFLPGHISKRTE